MKFNLLKWMKMEIIRLLLVMLLTRNLRKKIIHHLLKKLTITIVKDLWNKNGYIKTDICKVIPIKNIKYLMILYFLIGLRHVNINL